MFNNTNCIIHETCLLSGKSLGHIDSMHFCISFTTKKAEEDADGANIWMQGTVMDDLLSHKLSKIKFVFDRTIIHKEKWTNRGDMLQLFNEKV